MSETTESVDVAAATEAPPQWSDVAEASTEAQAEPPKTVRRLVRWKLEAQAMADLGRELAQEQVDLKAIKDERKSANARFREDIEETEAKIQGLTEAIRSGMGTREVEVRERFDPDTGRTELVGLDGMVYEAADMSQGRQLTLAEAAKANGGEMTDCDHCGERVLLAETVLTDEPARLCKSCKAKEDNGEDDYESPDSGEDFDDLDDSDPPPSGPEVLEETVGDAHIIDQPTAILEGAAEDETSAEAPKAKRTRARKAKG